MEYTDITMSENTKTTKNYYIYNFIKRCIDILFGICVGIVFIIPMLVIAFLIRVTSPGPALFKQERLGLNGKPFIMLKFRTMHTDAEKNGPQWAKNNDERCTKLGAFLRKTRLDELPQAWNILKGEMSVVGPRPERSYFYDEFEKTIPDFRARLTVKPGLTGLAQINGGYDLNPEEKLSYDKYYIEHRSLMMDIRCILKTVKLVFTHEGAR